MLLSTADQNFSSRLPCSFWYTIGQMYSEFGKITGASSKESSIFDRSEPFFTNFQLSNKTKKKLIFDLENTLCFTMGVHHFLVGATPAMKTSFSWDLDLFDWKGRVSGKFSVVRVFFGQSNNLSKAVVNFKTSIIQLTELFRSTGVTELTNQ